MKPFVMGFESPHKVGTICRPPFSQCGESEEEIGDMALKEGKSLAPIPIAILAQATYEDYVAFCKQEGAEESKINGPWQEGYYYFVSMD